MSSGTDVENEEFLPFYDDEESFIPPSPRQVLRIAINLKHLIDSIIPITFDKDLICGPTSRILNGEVIKSVYRAAGGVGDGKPGSSSKRYQSVLVFTLLKVCQWYWSLSEREMSDNELYACRALAAQQIAAIIIENEKDEKYLFIFLLCHRYSINLSDQDEAPESALELAVDMHSTIVIGSSGYQRCIRWLWRGWIVQSAKRPTCYVLYKGTGNTSFKNHFDPDRIKTPLYQNILEILFSFFYLAVYTVLVNQDTRDSLSFLETVFYLSTFGFLLDELVKWYHIGNSYFRFWNCFNDAMYGLVLASMVIRFTSLAYAVDSDLRIHYDVISYRVLSCAAPLMWTRLLLFLDVMKFVGTMIVVITKMMKESAVFFFLLLVILVGFLQSFLGLDSADGKRDVTELVFSVLIKTVISGPDFDSFERFAYPYATILYYLFTFMVTVILLNILIALYSNAYQNIADNSTEEYLALVAQKTLRYIRAPDEAVFVPPFNIIELVFLTIPFQWWLSEKSYLRLSRRVMSFIYSPVLVFTSLYEAKAARRVSYNRFKHKADDENEYDTEWDLTDGYDDLLGDNDEDVVQNMEHRIREGLREQRLAEAQDPEFTKEMKTWKNDVAKLVPPIAESNRQGIDWETFELFQKIEDLTVLVRTLADQNKELISRLKQE
ncbi:unnamed protein product [Kuraishia capsulata CBS 1993]|uniref:Ion transport domain-containing protein n=1 Tax=Kuraishia capsulata CBS 1993 TaxID=1382522 RepID=W6MMJ5_9ASCO|nr:uncharacterized protein KUCA_T00002128001 [Kuraishia capsulata CBS 1993]CDK26157.1 unnamed protein product [Kuraishia capsulata CBS 1993]